MIERLQQQRLTEIGHYLRQVRQEQQLSLENIAEQTRIRSSQLEAIEMGNMHRLPPSIYVQRFIQSYANLLQLNGSELASQFPLTAE